MTGGRQDGWSPDEDTLLAEVILRHIREGSTQLKAFEEVGNLLSRTAAACGFRWNSAVRKQYQDEILHAKKQRRNVSQKVFVTDILSERRYSPRTPAQALFDLDLDSCVHYLQDLQVQLQLNPVEKTRELVEENQYLQTKLQSVLKERDAYEKKYLEISDDYQSLLGFFEKARRLALQETETEPKLKFQMDQNGNLERV